MGGFNLPPGCSVSDLPGWNDIEVTIGAYCEGCGDVEIEDVTVDSRGLCDWEAECPGCGKTLSGEYDPNPYDY